MKLTAHGLHSFFVANKETAFVHAITSAGVVYEVTRACSRGELRECNCDRKNAKTRQNDGFQWGGCSENVGYGIQFARSFIDSRETQQDPPALMNLHNNKVGRKVSVFILFPTPNVPKK